MWLRLATQILMLFGNIMILQTHLPTSYNRTTDSSVTCGASVFSTTAICRSFIEVAKSNTPRLVSIVAANKFKNVG